MPVMLRGRLLSFVLPRLPSVHLRACRSLNVPEFAATPTPTMPLLGKMETDSSLGILLVDAHCGKGYFVVAESPGSDL